MHSSVAWPIIGGRMVTRKFNSIYIGGNHISFPKQSDNYDCIPMTDFNRLGHISIDYLMTALLSCHKISTEF